MSSDIGVHVLDKNGIRRVAEASLKSRPHWVRWFFVRLRDGRYVPRDPEHKATLPEL
jgi:hypothetical protein